MRSPKALALALALSALGMHALPSWAEDGAPAPAEAESTEQVEAADEAPAADDAEVQTRGAWDKRPAGARPAKAPPSGAHRQTPTAQPPNNPPDAPDPRPQTPRPARRPTGDADGASQPDAQQAPSPPPVAPPPRRPRAEDGLDTPEAQDPGPNPMGRPNRIRRAEQGDAAPAEDASAEAPGAPQKTFRNPAVRIGSQRELGADAAADTTAPATPRPPPRRRLSESDASESEDTEAEEASVVRRPSLAKAQDDDAAPELDPSVEAPTKILRKTRQGAAVRGALERLSPDPESAPRALRKPLGDYYALANSRLSANRDERLSQLDEMDRALTSMRPKAKGSDLDAVIEDEQELIRATARDPAIMNSPDVLSPTHALELKRVGIRPSAATRVADFQDANLQGEMKELGSGALNVVYRGKYRRADGTEFDGVFKEEATENSAQDGLRIGIPRTSPRFGLRNVATTKLDGLLGFDDLATASAMALHKGKLGTVSEFAEGESPVGPMTPTNVSAAAAYKVTDRKTMDEVNQNLSEGGSDQRIMMKRVGDRDEFFVAKAAMIDVNYSDPRLRRDLVRLQVLDSIAGQADRHPGNYKIRQDPSGKVLGLKAFDNDLAWGAARKPDGSFLKIKDLGDTKLPPELPPFVDEQTYNAVKSLTKRRLEQEMDGLLAQDEVDAAASRLEEVQAHFANLQAQGRVLKSEADWSRADVTAELTKPARPGAYNSYISRDLEVRRDKQAQGILLPYPGSQPVTSASN